MAPTRLFLAPMLTRVFAGVLVGLPTALFGGLLGQWLGARQPDPGGWRDLVGGIVGGAAGYLVGVAIGAGWVGARHRGAAIAIALLGGMLGGIAVLFAGALLGADRSANSPLILFLVAVPVAASGALRATLDRRVPGAPSRER